MSYNNADRKHQAEVRAARRAGYAEGCKATTLLSYLAIRDYGFDGIQWFSDRVSAAVAGKKDPPLSSYEIDKAVTADVIRHMARYSPARAAEIEKSFEDFLTTT